MSIFKIIFLVIITIVFFQFLDNSNDEFDGSIMLPYDTKVLAFGDSLTYGYQVDTEDNYPSQLSKLLQTKVINAGVNGELSGQGLKRLPALLEKHKPQVLIICEGGNDILRRRNLVETKENIAKMIKMAQKKHIHVVLIGVPMVEVLSLSTAQIYYELRDELNVPLEDSVLKEIFENDSLKVDQIHPNKEGYTILSNTLANLITNTYLPFNSFE